MSSGSPEASTSGTTPVIKLKVKRASRACDGCHARGVKCVKTSEAAPCDSCLSYEESCTYLRPVKRRGPRKAESPLGSTSSNTKGKGRAAADEGVWMPPDCARSKNIPMLLEVYRQVIYPLHPIFVWPALLARIAAKEHLSNRALCAGVLAACSISSAHLAQSGTLFFRSSEHPNPNLPPEDAPNILYDAAKSCLSPSLRGPSKTYSMDEIQAVVMMDLVQLTQGDWIDMRYFHGHFLAMASVINLHDESRWPDGLSRVEKQERRRVVWTAYQHQVFSSIVHGTPLERRETSILVADPEEVEDDELVYGAGEGRPSGKDCWMHGWNRCSDLYRILEHAVVQMRYTQHPPHASTITASLIPKIESCTYANLLAQLYSQLPEWARSFQDSSHDGSRHIYNYQTCNILITMQNARIISLCSNGFTTEEGVAVAKDLMDALKLIPHEYLLVNSTPVFHQLAGIGAILSRGTAHASLNTLIGVRSIIEDMSLLVLALNRNPTSANGSGSSKAHTALVRYAAEVDLYLSMRHGPQEQQQQQQHQPPWTPGADVRPFDPLPLPLNMYEGCDGFFDDLFTLPGMNGQS